MNRNVTPSIGKSEMHVSGKKIGNYVMTKTLGQGQFGKVYRARHINTGEEFAIKKIDMIKIKSNPILERLLQTEVTIMHEINHMNVLHLHEFLVSKNNYYLVIDFCNQGDFEHYLKKRGLKFLEEKEAVKYLKQIANGFQELRKKKILHRDFKLANLFMHQDNLVIGDFGFAKSGYEMAETKLGTPLTMAYEILNPKSENSTYNSKADLWSVGVVYYQMLFGETPFFGFSMPDLIKDIKKKADGKLKFPKPVSDESKDLLLKILVTDPKKRMDWPTFFNHPLFKKFKSEQSMQLNDVFTALGDAITNKRQQIDDEFNQHKNNTQNHNVQLMEQDDLLNYGKNNHFAPKNIQEITLDQKEKQEIELKLAFKEISFRYNHEKNKILFMVYVVKKIQKHLKEGCYQSLLDRLFNLSVLILKKAVVLNECNIIHLNNKTNVYKRNPTYFNAMMQTNEFHGLMNIFMVDRERLIGYLDLLNKRAAKSGIYLTNSNLIAQNMPDLNQLDIAMNNYYLQCRPYLNSQELLDFNKKRSFLLILVSVNFCINSEAKFPYMDNKTNMDSKFNWNDFYSSHENLSVLELSKMVN